MRIVDVFEIESGKVAFIQGPDLTPGIIIDRISTPYGVIDVLSADPVGWQNNDYPVSVIIAAFSLERLLF